MIHFTRDLIQCAGFQKKHSEQKEIKSNPNMQKDRPNQVTLMSNSIIQLELNKMLYQTTEASLIGYI